MEVKNRLSARTIYEINALQLIVIFVETRALAQAGVAGTSGAIHVRSFSAPSGQRAQLAPPELFPPSVVSLDYARAMHFRPFVRR